MLYFIMQATSDMDNRENARSHFDLNGEDFLSKLEKGTLAPHLFNHEAHLRMAWLYMRKYGLETAIDRACSTIRDYDSLHGSGSKFHFTLTAASVKVVHHFMQKSKAVDFSGFMVEFPVLNTDFIRLLNQHYDHEVLFSSMAKTEFIEPDLLPFD